VSQALKQRFAVKLAVEELFRTAKFPVFFTLTFAENITDRAEAERRWRRLRERIRRKKSGLRFVGCWQRQSRGAWHLHLVVDDFLNVQWLRPAAIECGFGPQMVLKPMNKPGFRRANAKYVADYVSRYIIRDLSDRGDDWKVRLPVFGGPGARVAVCRFGWARGISKLYRLGREWWSELFAPEQPTFEDYWFIVRLGWQSLLAEEQALLLKESEAVVRWWDPERYPF
jgi:hypothetical protein